VVEEQVEEYLVVKEMDKVILMEVNYVMMEKKKQDRKLVERKTPI
jgi:hypothetical protein